MKRAIIGLVLLAVFSPANAQTAKKLAPGPQPDEVLATPVVIPTVPVQVVNFPNPQNVAGTVNVGNLPLADDGAVRVSAAQPRQPVLLELLTEPLSVPAGGQAIVATITDTLGYSSFGTRFDATPVGLASLTLVPEWRWGADDSFEGVTDYRRLPSNMCLIRSGGGDRSICSVLGEALRLHFYNNSGSTPAMVTSVKVYLIP